MCTHVDTAELLAEHNNERREGCTAVSGNREELLELEAARLQLVLLLEANRNLEEVARGEDLVVTKAEKRLVGVVVAALADEPPRALRAHVNLAKEDEGRYAR